MSKDLWIEAEEALIRDYAGDEDDWTPTADQIEQRMIDNISNAIDSARDAEKYRRLA